ncbi:hypothetical protein SDC9_171013 [bioreactor metagenome]|uniref:Uncharacterized protein n=1 Tax=bioreactor metagenome TaxID=1076179 RepID=A0A645GC34_9ZZZZ
MGLFGQSRLPPLAGPGKGPLHIPEQLALQKVFGQGGAVDGDKGPVFAQAVIMDPLGEELLARSAFSHD